MWVSPFRYPRLIGYLLLPAAFRSLSRLSSALSAKASTLRPFLLNPFPSLYSVTGLGVLFFYRHDCLCSLFCSGFRHLFDDGLGCLILFYGCSCLCSHFHDVSDWLFRHLHWIFFFDFLYSVFKVQYFKIFDCFISHQKLKYFSVF